MPSPKSNNEQAQSAGEAQDEQDEDRDEADGVEEYEQDEDQGADDQQDEGAYGNEEVEDEDLDEDEMIDVAEKIFLLMAEKMVENKIQNVRDVFKPYIFEADIDGDIYELLSPYDLLQGIKDLGIEDL